MKRLLCWLWLMGLGTCLAHRPVCGQDDTPDARGNVAVPPGDVAVPRGDAPPQSGLPILQVTTDSLPVVTQLAARPDVNAIALQASLADIENAPAIEPALKRWVQSGGIVFLHNDAAQLFGYETVPARLRTNRVAGQLFGRARNAIIVGSHPLLWGAAIVRRPGAPGVAADTPERENAQEPAASPQPRQNPSPGVHLVYYEMQSGDHLVVNHPAGVPLLRVTDLAVPTAPLLFAAAIAPYGRGWAIFMPRFIETHRADGALLVQNVLGFIKRASPAAHQQAGAWLGMPANVIEGAANKALTTKLDERDFAALDQALTGTLEPANNSELPPNTPAAAPEQPQPKPNLLLTRGEVTAALDLVRRMGSSANDTQGKAQAMPRLTALLEVWDARLEMQRNHANQADAALEAAAHYAPRLADIALWQGVLVAGRAEDITLNTHEQIFSLRSAVTAWQEALAALPPATAPTGDNDTADATVQTTANPAPLPQDDRPKPERTISGIPRSLIGIWLKKATEEAALIRAESFGNEQGTNFQKVLGTSEKPLVLHPDGGLGDGHGHGLHSGYSTDYTWEILWGGEPGQAQISINGQILLRPPGRADFMLTHASASLGCWYDQEKIITFSSLMPYKQYRQTLGLAQQMPPAVIDLDQGVFKRLDPNLRGVVPRTPSFGDVVGECMIMVSGDPRMAPKVPKGTRATNLVDAVSLAYSANTFYPTTLGRMHTYVLLNKLIGGGTPPPDWMQLGMAARSAYSVMRDCGLNLPGTGFADAEVSPAVLARRMAAFGILGPAQFRGIVWNPIWDPSRASLAEPQAILMMEFFYQRFGPGCVIETLQRLGAGQTVDAALFATTGLTEAQFFRAWRASLG